MKPEQLDRLKKVAASASSEFDVADAVALRNALPTLLREREQLIGALRVAIMLLSDERDRNTLRLVIEAAES